MRLNRPSPMAPPDTAPLKAQNERVERVLKTFVHGLGTARGQGSATLTAMLGAFRGAAIAGKGGDACVAAALEAAKDHPMARQELEALASQSPLEAMLAVAADCPPQTSFAPLPAYVPDNSTHQAHVEALERIEMAAGASRENASTAAMSLLAAGQGIEAPSGMTQTTTSEAIVRMIQALARDIGAEGPPDLGETGAIENDKADKSPSPQSRRAAP
jgi:hypothetical protein